MSVTITDHIGGLFISISLFLTLIKQTQHNNDVFITTVEVKQAEPFKINLVFNPLLPRVYKSFPS